MATDRPFMDVELFPCSGGLAEGHRNAGIYFDLAIEYMPDHCDSYEHNIGHRPMQMDARDFLQMLVDGWKPPKPVRYLCADPPCTPWSRAGKRQGQDDPRDMLWGTCEIIRLLKPHAYLIGNVPGLDDGPNLPIVQRTIGALSQYGYCTADFARLDAVNYGVPQHRVRPWWFGHLSGPCIQWPAPTHGDPDVHGNQLSVPGVAPLIPWVTCWDALSFLPDDERGRPIKLRRRTQNSVQHGSVPERPARTVGTSNLSDGNVVLGDEQLRAKKRGGKNHGTPQGERVTDRTSPSPTVTKAIHHTQIGSGHLKGWDHQTKREAPLERTPRHAAQKHATPTIPFGMATEIFGAPPPLELEMVEPKVGSGYRARDDHRVRQGDRVGDAQKPSVTITAKVPRSRAGAHATIDASTFTIQEERGGKNGLNRMNAPSKAIVKNTHGNGSVIVTSDKHPAIRASSPATTIRGGGEGHSAPSTVLSYDLHHPPGNIDRPGNTVRAGSGGGATRAIKVSSKHPASKAGQPANTVVATDGMGNTRAMEWPWKERPSVTVCADDRLPPPGHHDESYGITNVEGDGIVISERAAAILQGFPDTLVCDCPGLGGKVRITPWMRHVHPTVCDFCEAPYTLERWMFAGDTKKIRFSQIGQAMPPPFAFAVATSVARYFEKLAAQEAHDAAAARFRHEMKLNLQNYRCTNCEEIA